MKAYVVDETESYNVELTAHIIVDINEFESEDDAVSKAREEVMRNPMKYLNLTYIEKR